MPFARQSLAGRRGRTALLVLAVLLSSALVVATACGIASVERSVRVGIEKALGASDARVVQRYSATFPADVLDRVRALDGVEAACGRLFGSITLARADAATGPDGRRRRATVQARGTDAPEDPRFREVSIEQGRRPEGDGEVLIDPATAEALAAAIGDRLVVERFGEPIELTVVGTFKRPRLGSLQRPLVEMSRRTLCAATNQDDELTTVLVLLKDGVDAPAWIRGNRDVVQEPLVLEAAAKIKTGLDRQMVATRLGFTLAASIAFLSCAFIVAVGLTTAVTEQEREMAIARCVGASRGQLFVAQLLVGLAISITGGVLGIPVGMALAWGLVRHWSDYLPAGFTPSPLGFALALVGCVLAGTLGAAYPAWQASRVTPMEALRVRARPPRPRHLRICIVAGCACIAAQLLLFLLPDVQLRFWAYTTAGLGLLFIGYFLLAPPVLVAANALLGGAIERTLALPRGLLTTSVRSMPYRFGFTAGALMVGMAVLVATWSGSAAVLEEVRDRVRFADGFVLCSSGIDVEGQRRIAAMPGVEAAVPVGFLPVRLSSESRLGVRGLGPANVICVGFDPEPFLDLNRIDFLRGNADEAIAKLKEGNAVIVAEQFLVARGVDVGDTIGLGGRAGDLRFEIAGVVSSAGLEIAVQLFGLGSVYLENAAGCVFMDFDAVERHFGARDAKLMQLKLDLTRGPELDEELRHRVEEEVPGATFSSGRTIRAMLDEISTSARAVTASIAFAALVLACFGVGNVVAAGIAARRHEFGVLRAVGGANALLPRLVLGEALIIAIAAGAVGLSMGLHFAVFDTTWHRDLAGLVTHVVIPWSAIAGGWLVMIAMTALAALPAALSLLKPSPRALLAARS